MVTRVRNEMPPLRNIAEIDEGYLQDQQAGSEVLRAGIGDLERIANVSQKL